jgi:hypothetical protein
LFSNSKSTWCSFFSMSRFRADKFGFSSGISVPQSYRVRGRSRIIVNAIFAILKTKTFVTLSACRPPVKKSQPGVPVSTYV